MHTKKDEWALGSYCDITAKQEHLRQCHVCLTLNHSSHKYCQSCGSQQHELNPYSVQQTLALLITAIVLFFPANFLPMMHTTFLGEKMSSTILGGVISLWQQGSYLVAVIIFFASIVIPIGKIIALLWLCYNVSSNKITHQKLDQRLYRMVELIGRWSMIDVFVVAILVAMIHMGAFMNVEPGSASLAFTALVIVTMLASMTFDPRRIWQKKLTNNMARIQ